MTKCTICNADEFILRYNISVAPIEIGRCKFNNFSIIWLMLYDNLR